MNYGDRLLARFRPRRLSARLGHEFRRVTAPIGARRTALRDETFVEWDGRHFPYYVHPHNTTWRNERAVELPLALDFIARHGRGTGLEFGNVLGYYGERGDWAVVDRYDVRPDVENVDILEYRAPRPLDFIVSISTLEHVGWDEKPVDAEKALRALNHLRSLLTADGLMFLTVPMGHHSALDAAIMEDRVPVERQMTMVRDGGRWLASPTPEWRSYEPRGGVGADSVWVAEIGGQ